MIRPHRKNSARRSAGDTIIEVLIVLAVLGLGLSVAYATANRGLQTSQAAQEHSQALSLMASQIEQVRTAVAASNPDALQTTSAFCFDNSHTLVKLNGFKPAAQENLAELTDANYTANGRTCVVNGLYYQSVTYDGSGLFTVKMRWAGLGTLGAQQESLNYRLYTVSPTNNNINIANGRPTGGNLDASGGIVPVNTQPDPPKLQAFVFNGATGVRVNITGQPTALARILSHNDYSGRVDTCNTRLSATGTGSCDFYVDSPMWGSGFQIYGTQTDPDSALTSRNTSQITGASYSPVWGAAGGGWDYGCECYVGGYWYPLFFVTVIIVPTAQ